MANLMPANDECTASGVKSLSYLSLCADVLRLSARARTREIHSRGRSCEKFSGDLPSHEVYSPNCRDSTEAEVKWIMTHLQHRVGYNYPQRTRLPFWIFRHRHVLFARGGNESSSLVSGFIPPAIRIRVPCTLFATVSQITLKGQHHLEDIS